MTQLLSSLGQALLCLLLLCFGVLFAFMFIYIIVYCAKLLWQEVKRK